MVLLAKLGGCGRGLWFGSAKLIERSFHAHPARPATESQEQPLQEPSKTCLYNFHVTHGGKMVPFAGFLMPIKYDGLSIKASHLHTRQHTSIFDVSHMVQSKIHGKDCVAFMESLTPADILSLHNGQGTLSVLTTDVGTVMDDLIICKTEEGYLYVVSNAACRQKDLTYLQSKLDEFRSTGGDASLEVLEGKGLLAVQGPGALQVMKPLVSRNLDQLPFMRTTVTNVGAIANCRVTRCGYTGEDGFEISVPEDQTEHLAKVILNSKEDNVQLAGLGARDSLRLEAGLCLYGNDMDETTTPIEASLAWLISKRRREMANFPGAERILAELANKPSRRRVGFVLAHGPNARANCKIMDENLEVIGKVTSGCPSPTLQTGIAMGYVQRKWAKIGTKVLIEIRNKNLEATVAKMPFVPVRYSKLTIQ